MLAPQQTCLKNAAKQEGHAWRIFPVPYDLLSIRGRRSRYSRPKVALPAAEGNATFGRESMTFQASQEKMRDGDLFSREEERPLRGLVQGESRENGLCRVCTPGEKRTVSERAVWFAAHLPNTYSRLRALFLAIGFCGCFKSAPSSSRSTLPISKKPFLQDKTFTKL